MHDLAPGRGTLAWRAAHYGWLLVAGDLDLVTIQAAMGHSYPATTSRYLHARPASDQAEMFTRRSVALAGRLP